RAAAIDAGRGEIWLEKIVFTHGTDQSGLHAGLPDDLLRAMGQTAEDEAEFLQSGRAALKKLFEKLPPEITSGEDALSPDDERWLDQILREGMERLIARMRGPGEGR
ncbi:MAG TPA: hypothetical protein PKM95_01585, partial [Deltaproteobacteria bacterium]|nr:hypothetical protein [Deltaproteobacteria bacterium]